MQNNNTSSGRSSNDGHSATGGARGPQLAFIKELIAQGARFRNVWAPKEIVNGIYRSVAIAVARGNAEIVASNLRHTGLAAWNSS